MTGGGLVENKEMDFAKTMKRLEHIVKSLESGTLSLEKSLEQFEEGIKTARYLESVLDRAEKKVLLVLNPPGDDGPSAEEC